MKLYAVPGLYCPFPTIVHPDGPLIETHARRFLLNFHLVETQEQFIHYCNQRFGTMVARCYPLGLYYDLATWCDMHTLLFILDDQLEEMSAAQEHSSLRHFEEQFMQILQATRFPVTHTGNPLLNAWGNVWERIVNRSGKAFQQRLADGFRDMFRALRAKQELCNRRAGPSLNEYYTIRPYLGGVHLATDSLELTAQLTLPPAVYQDAAVRAFTNLARQAICMANDLFSLGNESSRAAGAEMNLVSVLRKTKGLTMEAAILQAATLHDDAVRQFVAREKLLYTYPEDINTPLRKYVEGLQQLMIGNIVWNTRETAHYPHEAAGGKK